MSSQENIFFSTNHKTNNDKLFSLAQSPASKASNKRKGDAKDEVNSGLKEDKKKTKAVQSRNQIHVIDSGSSSDEDDDLTLKALSSQNQNQNQNQNEQKKKKGRGGGKNVISIDQRKDVDASDSEQQPIQITQEETEVEEQEPINLTQLTQETSAYSAGIKNTQDSLGTEVTGRRRDKKGGGGGGGKQAAQPNDLVLMVPEKFLKTKVLVQFEKDSESLDLSGDFGAVGRFLVSKHEAEDNAAAKTATEDRTVDDQVEIRMDLKGQLYNCR